MKKKALLLSNVKEYDESRKKKRKIAYDKINNNFGFLFKITK
jgi:chromosome segregation ATPase